MKLEDIQKMIEEDSDLSESNLDRESLKVPYLHAKYYKIFLSELQDLRKVEAQHAKIKKDLTEYFLGKSDDDVYKKKPLDAKIIKNDLDLYLSADDDYAKSLAEMTMQKAKCDMLEGFIKTLTNRGFLIKNAIEFMKFKNGSF